MRTKGKIASWNDDKGYGFIAPLAGGVQVFVHITAFGNRNRRPELDEVVTYSMSTDEQGRPRAINATLAGDKLLPKGPNKPSALALTFTTVFVVAVVASVAFGSLQEEVLIGYVALSLITFAAYAFDKRAARKRTWRTSEGTLLLLGLAGGWPRAVLAQEVLRHKSSKASFRIVFRVTVVLNCVALAWLHTENGRDTLQQLLG